MTRYQDAIQALIDTAHRQGHALTLYSHKLDLDTVYTLVDLTDDIEVFFYLLIATSIHSLVALHQLRLPSR